MSSGDVVKVRSKTEQVEAAIRLLGWVTIWEKLKSAHKFANSLHSEEKELRLVETSDQTMKA